MMKPLTQPLPVYIRNRSRKIIFKSTALTLVQAVIQAHAAGVPLEGARLDNVDFKAANLRGIDLRGAHLSNVNFHRTDLSGANLSGSLHVFSNYNDVNLTGANLSRAVLKNTDVHKSYLNDSDMRGVKMSQCQASLTEFHRTDLRSSVIDGSEFERSEFESATLENAEILDSNFHDCSFLSADLSHTSIEGSSLTKIKAGGMELRFAAINKSTIQGELSDVNFASAILTDVQLNESRLTDACPQDSVPVPVQLVYVQPVEEGPRSLAALLSQAKMQN